MFVVLFTIACVNLACSCWIERDDWNGNLRFCGFKRLTLHLRLHTFNACISSFLAVSIFPLFPIHSPFTWTALQTQPAWSRPSIPRLDSERWYQEIMAAGEPSHACPPPLPAKCISSRKHMQVNLTILMCLPSLLLASFIHFLSLSYLSLVYLSLWISPDIIAKIISVLLCKVLEVRSLLLGLVALVLSSSLLWGQVAIAVILDGEYE